MDLFLLRETSMTLTEIDTLKKHDPERLYRFYYFILEEKKEERRKIDKMKDKGDYDTLIMEERVSDIPEGRKE